MKISLYGGLHWATFYNPLRDYNFRDEIVEGTYKLDKKAYKYILDNEIILDISI
jgi:hypothetical protein